MEERKIKNMWPTLIIPQHESISLQQQDQQRKMRQNVQLSQYNISAGVGSMAKVSPHCHGCLFP